MTQWESRFVRPAQPVLDHLVSRAFVEAGETRTPAQCTWVEHGSNTVVALGQQAAVRIARQPAGAAELLRAQALVDTLPELPFAVPRSLGDPVEVDGYVAIPTMRLHGVSQPPHPPDAVVLRDLLETVHEVDIEPLSDHLAPPRSFYGGTDWEAVLTDQVVPLLVPELRHEALARISDLAAVGGAPPALNHGDLGSSNVLWSGGRITAVLDWDLAAADDPAEDVATVATSFRAWSAMSTLLDADTMRRAAVFRRGFPLQIVAFAVLGSRSHIEVERAVARAERGLVAD